MKFAKFLAIPILKNICGRLLLYFHYNSHHHFHYHHVHYHCKMHLYCLRLLLTIPSDCSMIPFLFQLNFIFFLPTYIFGSLIQASRFLRPVKRTTQILDVLFILISIVIYTSLFTLNCFYLFTLTYLYLCPLYTIT